MSSAAQIDATKPVVACPTEIASDSFSSGEGQMGATWTPTITHSGINFQLEPSLTILHNGVVSNPRQVPYGLPQGTPVSSDQQNPKALWNQTITNDQYVQITYSGGVAYSELFTGRDPAPGETPRSLGMTGDSFGDLTFENIVTGNSFISPNLDSSAWTVNPFNIHPSTDGYFDLVLRCDPVGRAKCYTLRIFPGGSTWGMYAGTSVIASGSLNTKLEIGDVFSFMVSRFALSAFQNGVRFASVTDKSYKSGQAGIGLNLIDMGTYGWQDPLLRRFSVGTSGTPPTIDDVSPTSLLVGGARDFYADGSNLGNCGGLVTHFSPSTGLAAPAPVVTLPNQLNLLPSIDMNAQVGTYNVAVASPAGMSNWVPFSVVAPTHMVVDCSSDICDTIAFCSGCSQTVQRSVTYQVVLSDGQAAAVLPIGEILSDTGWNCEQAEPPVHGDSCAKPAITDGYGRFTDVWWMTSDGYSPAGCGWNVVDHWQMCGVDLNGNPASLTFGTLTGFHHWDAIQINGVTSSMANPTPLPKGTVILP